MLTTLDKFGRVIIPKKLRKKLGIHSGSNLNISDEGNRIVLEVIHEDDPIVNKDGILVYTGKLRGDIKDEVKKDRRNRIAHLLKDSD